MTKGRTQFRLVLVFCGFVTGIHCFGPAKEAKEVRESMPALEDRPDDVLGGRSETAPEKNPGNAGEKSKHSLTPDLRMIYTTAGFGWRTTDPSQETSCNMCRAGTPIVLENRPKMDSGQPDGCDVALMALRGDLPGLLSLLLDRREQMRNYGVALAAVSLDETHGRVVHGLMTHPRPEVRGAALHLAGLGQMNMFLPELSHACRHGEPEEKSGARSGVHALRSLGGQTLAKEFPLDGEPPPPSKRPDGLAQRCPGPASFVPASTDHAISALALGAYLQLQEHSKAPGALTSAPPIIKFAHSAAVKRLAGDQAGLETHRAVLHTLLTRGPGCAVHPCDWMLLDALDASLLSLSSTKR